MSQSKTRSKGRPAPGAKTIPAKIPVSPPLAILTPRRTAIVLVCLFAVGLLLRLQHVDDVKQRTPDELTYNMYGSQIAQRGIGVFPALVAGYNADPRLQLYPPPTRVGHLVLLAGVMNLTGAADVRAGYWLSCLASVMSLALLGWIGYRFLPPLAAVYALLSLAVSVPDLVDARRGWQDSAVAFVALLLVWAVCEITGDPLKWWPYAVLVTAGSYSVLMKELMAFVYLGCVLYVIAVLIHRRAWKTLLGLSAAGLAGAGLCVLCLVKAAGGLGPLFTLWQHLSTTVKENPYGVYQTGPWYRWIWGFWILGPVNLVLALVAAAFAVVPGLTKVLDDKEVSRLRFFAGLTVGLSVLLKILPNSQNFRYLGPVYGAMYCMGGLGLWALWKWSGSRLSLTTRQALGALATVAVVWGAVTGYQHFEKAFVTDQVPDLSIKMVVDSR